ncbi:hypothetical protein R1sor_023921 [Riccia sorocarpa]|uniref:Carotenoid cleavage dioxygenase n=1 Tax=Riccia sorocarpa TaxID=122646 RepID=A0ABD3GSA1_9MARC
MEAVSVARSEVFRCVQTSAFTRFEPIHANLSPKLLCAQEDGNGSRGHRLQCSALQQNEPSPWTEKATKGASELLQKAVQLEGRNDKPKVQLSAAGRPRSRNGAPGSIARTFANSLFEFLQYTPLEEENPYTMNNFAAVDEIGEKVPVELISGTIPLDFPPGAYIRTGPNPLFGGKSYKSRLGITRHHWFEGDGMLHALYFDKCDDGYSLFLRFGFLTRPTSSTAVWSHSGRVFAAAEGNLPYEIDISDLRTLGKFNCKGAWPLDNFIAHSKIDPVTNELIFQGMSMKKPYTPPSLTLFLFQSTPFRSQQFHQVVVHGLRSRSPFLNVDINADKRDWYTRGVTVCAPDQEVYDPLVDGALLPYLHEWRFDLKSGTVTERDICEEKEDCMGIEFPRVNDKFVGRKYRYGYAAVADLDKTRKEGGPYYFKVVKFDFSSVETGKGLVKAEFHKHGPYRFGGEPVFVARPGSTEEDDGWIIMFVYDETTAQSEAVIIDARRLSEEPVARIRLPQRVPFGFHGTYVYSG